MTNIQEIICCHCKHKHEKDFDKFTSSSLVCEGCGRKVEIWTEGGTMVCDNCGGTCECEGCVNAVHVSPLCRDTIKGMQHDWKPTLYQSHEKCSRCYEVRDIRKIK